MEAENERIERALNHLQAKLDQRDGIGSAELAVRLGEVEHESETLKKQLRQDRERARQEALPEIAQLEEELAQERERCRSLEQQLDARPTHAQLEAATAAAAADAAALLSPRAPAQMITQTPRRSPAPPCELPPPEPQPEPEPEPEPAWTAATLEPEVYRPPEVDLSEPGRATVAHHLVDHRPAPSAQHVPPAAQRVPQRGAVAVRAEQPDAVAAGATFQQARSSPRDAAPASHVLQAGVDPHAICCCLCCMARLDRWLVMTGTCTATG